MSSVDPVAATGAVAHVFEDRARDGAGPAQIHTLGWCDTMHTASVLHEWVRSAGLEMRGFVPGMAFETAIAAAEMNQLGPGLHAVLLLGEQSSVLAVGSRERLRLVRPVRLGIDALLEAMTRPFAPRTRPNETLTLSRERAREILLGVGVPARDQMIDASAGIDGLSLLPLLQPFVQRVAVEVKQSLRFGLAEDEREGLVFHTRGLGALVPNLRQALMQSAGLTTHDATPVDQSGSGARTPPSAGPNTSPDPASSALDSPELGLMGLWARSPIPALLADSCDHESERVYAGARLMLRVGLLASAALVGLEGASVWARHRDTPDLSAPAHTLRAAIEAQRLLNEAQIQDQDVALRTSKALGDAPAWRHLLAELSRHSKPDLRLESIEVRAAEWAHELELRGWAEANSSPDATRSVRTYLASLQSLPILDRVDLSDTQRGRFEGDDRQNFTIRGVLVGTPRGAQTSGLATSDTPQEPLP
jgi:Tfp pilus assembly protein PilN